MVVKHAEIMHPLTSFINLFQATLCYLSLYLCHWVLPLSALRHLLLHVDSFNLKTRFGCFKKPLSTKLIDR